MAWGDADSTGHTAGYNTDVDQAAEQLTTTSVRVHHGLIIKAAPANTGTVSVGYSNAITTTSASFPLAASEQVTVPVSDPSLVWVIASADNQAISWIGV